MAWSEAARRAALLVRQARKKSVYSEGYQTYHTGNVGGKLINTERVGLAHRIRAMRRGQIEPNARVLATARVSTDFRNYKRSGKAVPRLSKEINSSVRETRAAYKRMRY